MLPITFNPKTWHGLPVFQVKMSVEPVHRFSGAKLPALMALHECSLHDETMQSAASAAFAGQHTSQSPLHLQPLIPLSLAALSQLL